MGVRRKVLNRLDAARVKIASLIDEAEALIPDVLLDRLPPSADLGGAPAWHGFEGPIWQLGENVRQIMLQHPALRKDRQLQDRIISLATNRRAHRGRQSFVMLLGYRACSRHGVRLAEELSDPCVDGQVISTLYRMKAPGHSDRVRGFMDHPKAWIRYEARRYVHWDSGA